MAELTAGRRAALSGGRQIPPPGDHPYGECITTTLPGGYLRIDQADPRILISGELLDAIVRWPGAQPDAWLNMTGCTPPPWRATYVGAVLHIDGVNRQVIYCITEYVPSVHAYIAEWPD